MSDRNARKCSCDACGKIATVPAALLARCPRAIAPKAWRVTYRSGSVVVVCPSCVRGERSRFDRDWRGALAS